MKISDVQTHIVSGGTRNYTFVTVTEENGLYGIGESGCSGKDKAVAAALEHYRPLLIGQDPARIEHIWQDHFRGNFWRAGPVLTAAISALDIALWDLLGKALEVPTYQLLGGKTRDKVRCYAHFGGGTDSPESFAQSAQARVDEGFEVVRFGLPTDPGDILEPARAVCNAVEAFQAVRETVGHEIEIALDVHTRLNPTWAIQLCKRLEPLRPFFIEDPIRSENPQSFANLRHHTSVPIATGEQLITKWQFRELIENELIDYMRADLGLVGGITEGKKIAAMSEVHYIDSALHNPLGPVNTAASVQLDMCIPNFGIQELSLVPPAMTDIFPTQCRVEAGHLYPADVPGIGIEFNAEAAKQYPYQYWEHARLHRDDGSLTDW